MGEHKHKLKAVLAKRDKRQSLRETLTLIAAIVAIVISVWALFEARKDRNVANLPLITVETYNIDYAWSQEQMKTLFGWAPIDRNRSEYVFESLQDIPFRYTNIGNGVAKNLSIDFGGGHLITWLDCLGWEYSKDDGGKITVNSNGSGAEYPPFAEDTFELKYTTPYLELFDKEKGSLPLPQGTKYLFFELLKLNYYSNERNNYSFTVTFEYEDIQGRKTKNICDVSIYINYIIFDESTEIYSAQLTISESSK